MPVSSHSTDTRQARQNGILRTATYRLGGVAQRKTLMFLMRSARSLPEIL
jgi:hypothetical protein